MLLTSPQRLFPFSRYLSFCLDFLVMYQNSLIKKIRLISNFMTSQLGQQTIVIHILLNISRSKGNQTMKFGQLIECNMRNIFLEKSYTKFGKLKLSMSLDQQSKVLYSFLLLHGKLSAIEKYQNLAAHHFLSPHVKLF